MTINIGRILCPVDFSEFSRHAFDHAVAIARICRSEVTLLNVAVPPDAFMENPTTMSADERSRLLDCLTTLANTEGSKAVAVQCNVRDGVRIDDDILAEAERVHADLIVMGTHGRSGFQHLVLGSITEKVLRKAACPVLTVPRRAPDAVPAGPPLYRRILCGIDFSDSSLAAFAYARALGGARTHIDLVSAVQMTPLIDTTSPAAMYYPGLYEEIRDDVGTRLEALAIEARSAGCDVDAMVADGAPYREILRLAAETKADLIVLGVRGHGAVDRFFFGSTADHVVRQATCPVLTVRKD